MSNLKKIVSDILKTPEGRTRVEVASPQVNDAIDMHKNPEIGRKLDVQSWLPMASEAYEISSDIKDYVVVPVIILPTDIPNRNSVAFPYEELLKFNVGQGRPNYKTWVGKPTYAEHQNHNPERAKGIVFDTYMTPLNNTYGNIHKLVALCGFDRNKDMELARQILAGQRKSYSMGAFIQQYECSVCGDLSKPGKLNTECGHVVRGKPKLYTDKHGHHIPSYLLARHNIDGFEVSSVGVPAWSSATNSFLMDMSKF